MQQDLLMARETELAHVTRCVEACEICHRACLHAAMNLCLEQGGPYLEPPHFRLLLACADLCRTTADAMVSALSFYEELCTVCAKIARECAASCRRVGELDACADACMHCADLCEQVAGGPTLTRARGSH